MHPAEMYRSASFRLLWQASPSRQKYGLLLFWLLSCVASIGLGLASVIYSWYALPVEFGGVEIYLSVYPPLLICMWWTCCFGWKWGAIPAYLSTLILALHSGMPWYWALLFACGNPIGLGVQIIGYRAITMPRALNTFPSWVFFVQMAFIGSVFSSSASLIWSYTNKIDQLGVFAIWQSWWLGNFLQSVFLVAPLLALTWQHLAKWQDKHHIWLLQQATESRRMVVRLLGVLVLGVLAYGLATIWLGTSTVALQMAQVSQGRLSDAAEMLSSMIWAFFWVMSLVTLFLGFFGYQMFDHWQKVNRQLLDELALANSDLAIKASTDALTGLANYQTINMALEDFWQRLQSARQHATLLMIDIDHFKRINDEHGHLIGDKAIHQVASLLRQELRDGDLAGRYGGEEFVVLLRRVVSAEDATQVAERIRERVAIMALPTGAGDVRMSISIGVAISDSADYAAEAWLKRADDALYHAKRSGRNRVVMAQ